MQRPTQEQAVEMLDRIIERGRDNAMQVIERIETSRPKDAVVASARVEFTPTLEMVLAETDLRMRLHDNALSQAMGRADIPLKFGRHLQQSEWGRALLATNLNEMLHNEPQRVLLRAVGGEVRAFLSDSYRRLDAAPIVNAFAKAMERLKAVPVDGVVGDLRLSLRAILPEILWVGDDPVVAGVALQTSDFGRGQLGLQTYTLRAVCTNGLTGENVLKAVHLGRRIDRESDAFSQRTHDLDSETMASAVGDLIESQLGPEAIALRKSRLEKAATTEIDPKAAFVELRKVLTKGETDAAIEVFTFGEDEQVPPGRNAWRLSNAISWVAKSAKDAERRLDLERLAGELLDSPAAKAAYLDNIIAQ